MRRWKRYPAYRDSGVEWLGEVPEGWEIGPVKRRFDIQLGRMLQNAAEGPLDEPVPYLKALHVQWFAAATSDLPEMWATPADRVKYGVRTGDLLVCEGGEGGRAAILGDVPENTIIQNALHRVRAKREASVAFLQYALSAACAQGWMDVVNNKATIAHFTRDKFSALPVPLPTHAEQRAIAAFLDRETGRIDALIALKQSLAERLNERWLSLISKLVSKGLHASWKTRASTLPWFGEIPEHWSVIRLGLLARVANGSTPKRGDAEFWSDGEIPWISSGQVNDYIVTEPAERISAEAMRASNLVLFPAGTVLVGMVGQGRTRGLAARLAIEACLNQNVAGVVVRDPRLDPRYLHLVLQACYEPLRTLGRGGNQDALNCEIISGFKVPVPPLKEQAEITGLLEGERALHIARTNRLNKTVALLREQRQALITAAVTGQIDIRGEIPEVA